MAPAASPRPAPSERCGSLRQSSGPHRYIQLGHSLLVLVILLAAFGSDPNFPLTNLPPEYRGFLKQGLATTRHARVERFLGETRPVLADSCGLGLRVSSVIFTTTVPSLRMNTRSGTRSTL